MVGTGGDNHSTFNVSTTASIVVSSELLLAKHGNRASTSLSGSADFLNSMDPAPKLQNITPQTIKQVYKKSNYAFLFAPVFHPGMKNVAAVRKELGWRTIFNLLGPLANPVNDAIEARIVGVARRDLGPAFAEALREGGASKAMVVCGEEDLDEISCAGKTFCWRIIKGPSRAHGNPREDDDADETSDEDAAGQADTVITHFTLSPSDFGLPAHPLSTVAPGKSPHENAALLKRLLANELPEDHPVLHFVLINAAALFVVAGICGDDNTEMWKEGVRHARLSIENGEALRSWNRFVEVSNELS